MLKEEKLGFSGKVRVWEYMGMGEGKEIMV
jgi:hypothetical protein